jgi:hypothetical protein
VIISLIANKKNKNYENIYKSWQTSLIGIFLLSLGGGYLFHNATPDYIVLSILLIGGVAFAFSDDIIKQLKSFLSKNQTHYNMFLTAITDYEDLGLKSLLIATIISMGFVIRYLHTSKESALNEK